jgi:DNA replication protein DnaC
LAKTVAYAATQQGFKVLFTTAMDMINHLVAAEADHSLLKKLHHYACPQLLLIDELGYLPRVQAIENDYAKPTPNDSRRLKMAFFS